MNGYLLTFYTELNQRHNGKQIHRWLLDVALEMNIKGVTVIQGFEGVDHQGKTHSADFFELNDEPIKIQFALSETEIDILLNRLENEDICLFYVKYPVEYGSIGKKHL